MREDTADYDDVRQWLSEDWASQAWPLMERLALYCAIFLCEEETCVECQARWTQVQDRACGT